MMIRFSCPGCKTVLQAPDGQRAALVTCPKCKKALRVPSPAATVSTAPSVNPSPPAPSTANVDAENSLIAGLKPPIGPSGHPEATWSVPLNEDNKSLVNNGLRGQPEATWSVPLDQDATPPANGLLGPKTNLG